MARSPSPAPPRRAVWRWGSARSRSKPIEEVVAANPHTFFQIYWAGDRDSIVARMERARAAGAKGIILTLDWSFVHSRDWGSPKVPASIDFATGEGARARGRRSSRGGCSSGCRSGALPGFGVPNFAFEGQPVPGFFEAYGTWMGTPPPSWDDVAWLRSQWDGPFMVKGIGRPDEARRAVDAGVVGDLGVEPRWQQPRRHAGADPRCCPPWSTRSATRSKW